MATTPVFASPSSCHFFVAPSRQYTCTLVRLYGSARDLINHKKKIDCVAQTAEPSCFRLASMMLFLPPRRLGSRLNRRTSLPVANRHSPCLAARFSRNRGKGRLIMSITAAYMLCFAFPDGLGSEAWQLPDHLHELEGLTASWNISQSDGMKQRRIRIPACMC